MGNDRPRSGVHAEHVGGASYVQKLFSPAKPGKSEDVGADDDALEQSRDRIAELPIRDDTVTVVAREQLVHAPGTQASYSTEVVALGVDRIRQRSDAFGVAINPRTPPLTHGIERGIT